MPSVLVRDRSRHHVIPELHRLGLALGLMTLLLGQVWLLAGRTSSLGAVLAIVVLCGSLLTVTRSFWPSAVAMVLAIAGLSVSAPYLSLVAVAPVVGVYAVTHSSGRTRGAVLVVLSALALALPSGASLTAMGVFADLLRNLFVLMAAVAFGEANRTRKERMVDAESRAAEAERLKQAEADRAVSEERLRIARELHDVTAHSLSVISIQSELARSVVRTQPDAAERAIEAIGDVSRESLGELRAMLGQLRGVESGLKTPSLVALDELLSGLRLAGCAVEVTSAGSLDGLPPFIDATAYRILQEAVTNVIKHAPGSSVWVDVDRDDSAVSLSVLNDRAASESARTGNGLLGMRERAHAVGGTLEAGFRDPDRWMVAARLPLHAQGDGGSGE